MQFHIQGDITNYSKKHIDDIVVTVASILHCNQYDILVNGLKHSESFMLLLSLQKRYIWKLSVLDKHDCIKLVKLNIDYIILDQNKISLKNSEGMIYLCVCVYSSLCLSANNKTFCSFFSVFIADT